MSLSDYTREYGEVLHGHVCCDAFFGGADGPYCVSLNERNHELHRSEKQIEWSRSRKWQEESYQLGKSERILIFCRLIVQYVMYVLLICIHTDIFRYCYVVRSETKNKTACTSEPQAAESNIIIHARSVVHVNLLIIRHLPNDKLYIAADNNVIVKWIRWHLKF